MERLLSELPTVGTGQPTACPDANTDANTNTRSAIPIYRSNTLLSAMV